MCNNIKNNKSDSNNESNCNNIKCNYCNSDSISKIGHSSYNNKQRYKCNNYNKTQTEGKDNRIKHSLIERKFCITSYLNGTSMREIQKKY